MLLIQMTFIMDDHIYHHSFFPPYSCSNTGVKGLNDSSGGPGSEKHPRLGKKGATWTPSVSLKVNISNIPPSTLVCRDQRSWWQTSDPGALRGQKRSLWNLSVEGLGTFSPAQKLQLKRQLTTSSACTRPNLWLWHFCGSNIQVELKVNTWTQMNLIMCCSVPFHFLLSS